MENCADRKAIKNLVAESGVSFFAVDVVKFCPIKLMRSLAANNKMRKHASAPP
jgi:hypothetical protein